MNEEDLKRCPNCDFEKELSEFSFRKDTQKYRNQCRDCTKLIIKKYKSINQDEIKLSNRNSFQNNTEGLYKKNINRYKTDITFHLN